MPKNTKTTDEKPQSQQQFNSEQYVCKCQKIYKSYPALYTHIKNKHPKEILQYKNFGKKPKNKLIEKGRPKKNKMRPKQAQLQGQLLNIIELGVFNIEECLKKQTNQQGQITTQNGFLLIGNQIQKFQELDQKYQEYKNQIQNKLGGMYIQESLLQSINEQLKKRNINQLLSQQPIKVFKQEIKFKNELIQHFSNVLAAKVILALELIEIQKQLKAKYDSSQKKINLIDQLDLQKYSYECSEVIAECELNLWANNQELLTIVRNIKNQWEQMMTNVDNMNNPQNSSNVGFVSQNSIQQASDSQYNQ